MKKVVSLSLVMCLILILNVGCSSPSTGQKSDSEEDVITADVDFTVMSSTLITAEVYNLLTRPSEYMGKTIKIAGLYSPLYFSDTDNYYHYVTIPGADACCAQGIEFMRNGAYSYPDDYPKENAVIEVFGVYDSYEESDQTWYYLSVDNLVIKYGG